VIRLLSFDRLPKRSLRLNRHTIFARDGHRCQYCNRRFPGSQLSLDHVVPRSRGGQTTWENVVCACLQCNVKKGGRTPQEAHMRLGRKPSRPKRSPLLLLKLGSPKYESWRTWLEAGYWEVGI
jgi:5-methylcytosine-specific restriction endonuclease McrA